MRKTKSCAGCRALFHKMDGGVYCCLRKKTEPLKEDEEVLDTRLDQYVDIRPIETCKVRTVKELVYNQLIPAFNSPKSQCDEEFNDNLNLLKK